MKIFISYRRDDSAGYAGRLFDHLTARFGARSVFMDIDTIQPGEDFRKAIQEAVGTCDVVLVLIGKQWVNATNSQGQRRLDDPGDFVRAEVAGALANPRVRVIPVLVRDASMPGSHELPDDIGELSWRNAIELSDHRFPYDVNKLIGVIEQAGIQPARTSSGKIQNLSRWRNWGILFVVLALGFAIWRLGSGVFPRTDIQASPPAAGSPVAASPAVEANELALIRTIPGYGQTASAALSPDGKVAAAGYYDGMIKVWSVNEDTLLSTRDIGTTVTSLAISGDNQMIAAGLTSAVVRAWRIDGTELPIFEGLTDIVYSVAFSPDGQMLAAGDITNVIVWRVSDGTVLQTFGGHPNDIGRIVFSPDNQWLASASRGWNRVYLWRIDTNVLVRDFEADYDTAAAFSPDSERLATAGVYLWRVRDGERLQELKGHTQPAGTLAFSPDGQTLVSVSPDIEVRRWQLSDGMRLYTKRLDGTNVQSVELSTDGKVLMVLYRDGALKVWQVP